jgi:hypothetical protein
MALEGQLSDFSLEEILQLIAVQQKSGFLVLKHEQEMVFYFDHGMLVSVRDRRDLANDPLERYLRQHGCLRDEQWAHIDYVLANAKLDLTEILLSEHLMDEAGLQATLQAVAQDLIHQGMKLKRGSYHFTATSDVQTGIRGRICMDIQGLLMEAARRCDEEPRLLEALPSPQMTFARGTKPPQQQEIGEVTARLLKLALAGRSLGEIIAQGKVSAFTVRELLNHLCEAGVLAPVAPELAEVIPLPKSGKAAVRSRGLGLRQPAAAAVLLLLALAGGWLRWQPLLPGAAGAAGNREAPPGIATATADAASGAGAAARLTAAEIRLNQLRDDVHQAALLFRHEHGRFPADLSLLVKDGSLAAATVRTVQARGWTYRVADQGRSYTLGP